MSSKGISTPSGLQCSQDSISFSASRNVAGFTKTTFRSLGAKVEEIAHEPQLLSSHSGEHAAQGAGRTALLAVLVIPLTVLRNPEVIVANPAAVVVAARTDRATPSERSASPPPLKQSHAVL